MQRIRPLLHYFYEVLHKSFLTIFFSVALLIEISVWPSLQKQFLGVEEEKIQMSLHWRLCIRYPDYYNSKTFALGVQFNKHARSSGQKNTLTILPVKNVTVHLAEEGTLKLVCVISWKEIWIYRSFASHIWNGENKYANLEVRKSWCLVGLLFQRSSSV